MLKDNTFTWEGGLSAVWQLVQISFQSERYERVKLPALILPVIL